MRAAHVVLAAFLAFAPRLTAQMLVARVATAKDSVPETVAAAEAEGARWPHAERNNDPPPAPGVTIGGTAERRCVDADRINFARSGDFVAGPFMRYYEIWAGGYGKLWWQPASRSLADTVPLTVRVTRLDTAGTTAGVYTQPFLTHGVNIATKSRTSPDFYPSGIHVATAGRWLFVVTAGPNWGCYLLSVGIPSPALR